MTGWGPPAPTVTPRLRLEAISLTHVDDVAAMLADPQVAATMGGVRDRAFAEDRTRRQAQRWLDDGFGLWAAYSLADNGFVGRGGAEHTELEGVDVVELAWCLRPDRWGQGLATELGRAGLDLAFATPGVEEVVAFTLPHNAASRAVMRRLGLIYRRDCTNAGLPHVLYAAERPSP